MPIYEFRCNKCRKRSSVFVLSHKEQFAHKCPHCGSTDLTRIMSRFASVRSEESRMESLADPAALGDVNENDPASVARWMKRMGKELGEDAGSDVEEAADEAFATKDEASEEPASESSD